MICTKSNLNGTVNFFEFLVFSQCSHEIILGWDFFRTADAVIDCGSEEHQFAEILPDKINQVDQISLCLQQQIT